MQYVTDVCRCSNPVRALILCTTNPSFRISGGNSEAVRQEFRMLRRTSSNGFDSGDLLIRQGCGSVLSGKDPLLRWHRERNDFRSVAAMVQRQIMHRAVEPSLRLLNPAQMWNEVA